MSQIETLDGSVFVVGFAYDLGADVEGGHDHEADVEFEGHC